MSKKINNLLQDLENESGATFKYEESAYSLIKEVLERDIRDLISMYQKRLKAVNTLINCSTDASRLLVLNERCFEIQRTIIELKKKLYNN